LVKLNLALQGEALGLTEVDHLLVAGWTARDASARERHIEELERLGVQRPASTPIFYHVASARLTTASQIEVLGATSSGEVEALLLHAGGRLWIGVGSDHTDRKAEVHGVALSKQMCDKPIAPVFWPYDSVSSRWDDLVIRSYLVEGDERSLYQEGSLGEFIPPEELIARLAQPDRLRDGSLMFCGTLATRGGVRHGSAFAFELEDPATGQTIAHRYDVRALPVAG